MATKVRTAAQRLFNDRYLMMIPQMFFYDKNYLEKHGHRSTGDIQLDREMLAIPSRVMQTTVALAIFHSQGCPIQIVNEKDSVKIFNDIHEHLLDWERAIKGGIHIADVPPLDEFRLLENVATSIYRSAKYHEPMNYNDNHIRDRLMSMNMRRNPTQTDRLLRGRLLDDKGELKPYVSIVDRIEKELFTEY